jgi:hypothetical protein
MTPSAVNPTPPASDRADGTAIDAALDALHESKRWRSLDNAEGWRKTMRLAIAAYQAASPSPHGTAALRERDDAREGAETWRRYANASASEAAALREALARLLAFIGDEPYGKEGEAARAQARAALSSAASAREEAREAYGYAVRFLHALIDNNAMQQVEPLPTLCGVLTQIDNATTGIASSAREEALREALRKAREIVDSARYITLPTGEYAKMLLPEIDAALRQAAASAREEGRLQGLREAGGKVGGSK